MAETAVTPRHGDMPVQAQATTYRDVMGLFKWAALGTADLLVFLVFWFCTGAGFFPALVVSAILLVVGLVGLRRRRSPAH